jgi:hypothetical protein
MIMNKLTEPEVLEKWAHIAMKVFPPQTQISPGSGGSEPAIQVRWKAENDPDTLSKDARGVDLYFPPGLVAEYLSADAEIQLKHDAFIESEITQRLQNFDPYDRGVAQPEYEKWLIAAAVPTAPV